MLALFVFSCDEAIVYVDGVQISEPETTTYYVGDTVEVTVEVTPPDATLPDVSWTSDPAGIVDVEETTDGATITALAPGEVTVTASSGDGTVTDTLILTIEAVAVTAVAIDAPTTTTYTVGETVDLTAAVTPTNATDQGITWSTSDADVATVTATDTGATVTATGVGTVDIIATSDDDTTISDSITLTIDPIDVTGVSIDTPTYSLIGVGGGETLSVTVSPSDATDQTVSWSSSDTAVATVDSTTGEVAGVAAGTATITATTDDGSFSDTVEITVATVTVISSGPVAFDPGVEQRIEIAIAPADADLEYSVTVDDDTVAHVVDELLLSEVFRLVGLAQGTATVTVAAVDNAAVSDTVDINVGADLVDPKLVEFAYLVDSDTIQLQFTELMATASVEDDTIYTITVDGDAVAVTGATVVTPENPWYGTQVRVGLASEPDDGARINVVVSGGQDAAGNGIDTGANSWAWTNSSGFGSIDGTKIIVAADGTVSLQAGAVTMSAGYSGFTIYAVVPEAPDTNSYPLTYNTVNSDGSVDALAPFPSQFAGNQTVNENFQADILQTDGSGNAVFRNGSYGIGFSATNDSTGNMEFGSNEGVFFDVTTGW